ncbi:MAG: NAD(P)-dependent oxidoreductase, partial [candidate division NC10 bacterium]
YASAEHARTLNVTLVDLGTLLAESDIVSLHAVLTHETRGMIGEPELKAMKPTAFLVNTARGELVDEAALARAVEDGWIAGAALDTFEEEPLPLGSPLRSLDPERVILTPHNVSHSETGRLANLDLALKTILTALNGEVPEHVVNPQAAPRWRTRLLDLKTGGNAR